VRDQLSPFAEVGGKRLIISGPDIVLNPKAVEAIGLALHELATNAVKYGALSVPAGKVTVSWALENQGTQAPRLRLIWVEQGGPVVTAPSVNGFGHIVFEKIVARSLNGNVKTDFAPNGLIWELSVPAANLVAERDDILELPGFQSSKKF
jgi:two-component sensor histidine kinase